MSTVFAESSELKDSHIYFRSLWIFKTDRQPTVGFWWRFFHDSKEAKEEQLNEYLRVMAKSESYVIAFEFSESNPKKEISL